MSGGVPPSSRAGRSRRINVADRDVRKAIHQYERFTGHTVEDDECRVVKVKEMPKAATVIGDVDGILYTTVRDDRVERYIHKFAKKSDRPMLAVSPDGKQIFLIGGRYSFTERGIVDKSDKSR